MISDPRAASDLPPEERRLDELLVRYFDQSLSLEELTELEDLLALDPNAEERIGSYCVQGLTLAGSSWASPSRIPRPARRLRKRPWGWLSLGLAAALLLVTTAFVLWGPGEATKPGELADRAMLTRSTGTVRVVGEGTDRIGLEGTLLDPGETIATVGVSASAVLNYPDGTAVVLTGDTVATLPKNAKQAQLLVRHGAVSAEISHQSKQAPFTISTEEVNALADGGTKLALSRSSAQTEVGVTQGHVRVTDSRGDPLLDMKEGEMTTVGPNRPTQKRVTFRPADEFHLDLTEPLPSGWEAGILERPEREWSIRSQFWDDPLIGRTCQIRSDNRWIRGLFTLHPESRLRVKYKVDRPGRGQLLIVARPHPPSGSNCVVLYLPQPFDHAPAGVWQTVDLKGSDFRPEKPETYFDPPWIGFLLIFNTYEVDLGLRVSEFRVTPPSRP